MPTPLELLAPARTADIGIEAIRHGADAVYIGAERFGARSAAGNSLADIKRLADFAHQFGARVYVTINTLLKDEEQADVHQLIEQLIAIGTDAFIVQDVRVVQLVQQCGGSVHGSTQMDNRTADDVQQLYEAGISQVVLARELSLDEIRHIHQACPQVRLEVFVHGALCVSLSGLCNASELLMGRSANRGECAQICRMEFNLEDSQGHTYFERKHLLSLRDLCRLDALEQIAEAGAVSFKIEGRLKDMSYVKNVTAAYSEALNAICARNPKRYTRASYGTVSLAFRPDVRLSFNRGFTHYFLHGRSTDIFSFDTPKSVGVEIGKCQSIGRRTLVVASKGATFAAGDGLCFFNRAHRLVGFRVNSADGNVLTPHPMPHDLLPGMTLYRNFDKRWTDMLAGKSAERYVPVDISVNFDGDAFVLEFATDYASWSIRQHYTPELARTPQAANVERQLSRLGDTIYRVRSFRILYQKNYFIPSSVLSAWRRTIVVQAPQIERPASALQPSADSLKMLKAKQSVPIGEMPLMQCRHCLRYAMGWCVRRGGEKGPDQLYLRMQNGRRLTLDFDCKACMMLVRS